MLFQFDCFYLFGFYYYYSFFFFLFCQRWKENPKEYFIFLRLRSDLILPDPMLRCLSSAACRHFLEMSREKGGEMLYPVLPMRLKFHRALPCSKKTKQTRQNKTPKK